MVLFITGLHICLCFFLIVVVLLQTGKGADMGAAFGGASQTMFGATGALTLLHKVTTVTAVLFMLTSLSLAWNSSRAQAGGGGLDGDIFDKERGETGDETEAGAASETEAGAETGTETEVEVGDGTLAEIELEEPAEAPAEEGEEPAEAPVE